MMRKFVYSFLLTILPLAALAQIKAIPYGDMDRWMVREVRESGIIGGNTKYLYELAYGDTLKGNVPFVPDLIKSPWATSSVLAVVKGVTKGSCTVFPEPHGQGQAARLETRIETVKVLSLINISVLATGTLFLGEIQEPVRDTRNPQAKLLMGIPFTGHPKGLVFDYSFHQGESGGKRIKMTGFSRKQEIPGVNCAEVCLLLQKRWEDSEGNVFALRVGTAWTRYDKSTSGWVYGHEEDIVYGDMTGSPAFKEYLDLMKEEPHYCRNSKGEVVPIQEIGWAPEYTTPTHMILRFSSGHGGAYVGSPGAKLHIDNVKLIY